MDDPIERVQMWYAAPIEKLKELPDGIWGFAAFLMGLALYERLTEAKMKLQGRKVDDAAKEEMAQDLHLSESEQSIFWDMFRNGLLHGAMPKVARTQYLIEHSYYGLRRRARAGVSLNKKHQSSSGLRLA